MHTCTRAGKSSKISEHGLLLDVKCPQSCVEEILIPQYLPQNKSISPHKFAIATYVRDF